MSVTARKLVGREDELAAIVGLLDAIEQLPVVAVLPGEAGIGKTTLWLAGIEAATARGYRILSSRPSEAETRLSFVGLSDLLDNVARDVLPELPPIQRRALEAALLLGESELHADDRAVARRFPRERCDCSPPTVPFVSPSTTSSGWTPRRSQPLRFALSRLERESSRGVAGGSRCRAGLASPRRAGGATANGRARRLERRRDPRDAQRPPRRDVPAPDADQALRNLARQPLLRARACTPRSSDEAGRPDRATRCRSPRTWRSSCASTSTASCPDALEVARVVAAVAEPTTELVEAALGESTDLGLSRALDARILELDGEPRAIHPPSARIGRRCPRDAFAPTVATRSARGRSFRPRRSELGTSPLRRPSRIVRSRRSSRRPRVRPTRAARRRLPRAGRPGAKAHASDGQVGRRSTAPLPRRREASPRPATPPARMRCSTEARAEATPGADRAAVLVQLADVLFDSEAREAEALCRQALVEAEGDDALEAMIQMRLADSMRWRAGIEGGLAHATLAVQAASRTDDVALRCSALASHGLMHFKAAAASRARRWRRRSRSTIAPGVAARRTGRLSLWTPHLCWSADLDPARSLLQELLPVVRARNDAAKSRMRCGTWGSSNGGGQLGRGRTVRRRLVGAPDPARLCNASRPSSPPPSSPPTEAGSRMRAQGAVGSCSG